MTRSTPLELGATFIPAAGRAQDRQLRSTLDSQFESLKMSKLCFEGNNSCVLFLAAHPAGDGGAIPFNVANPLRGAR